MNIILIGPQGSGKGTQADNMVDEYGMKHFSVGDALRAEKKSGSELGNKVAAIMERGDLVSDDIVNEIVKKAVEHYGEQGLIFDGYPRKRSQAEYLKTIADVDAVVDISISDEEAVRRISSRYVCPECGKCYNTIFLPPKEEGKCDADGAALVQREDDKPDAVRKRLAAYHEQTEPIVKYYEEGGVPVHRINGEQPIPDVFRDIKRALE